MTAPKSSPPSRRYSRAAACGGRRAPSAATPARTCRGCAVSACPSPWPMRWPRSKRLPRSSPRRRAGRGRCERSPKRFSRREETGRAWSRNTWSNAAMSQSGRLDPVERGRRVLALEAEAIQALAGRLGSAFAHAVTLLSQAKGRVIVSGAGKSGLIARKIAGLDPGGTLGRKLLQRVADVMLTTDLPLLAPDRAMRECVVLLAEKRGTVAVVDRSGALLGVVTAGDLTRLMERTPDFLGIPVADVMTKKPKTSTPDELAVAAIRRMEEFGIMALPVVDGGRKVVGIAHLHDLMRAGTG